MKQIQDKIPQVVTTIKQELTNVTMTASAQKSSCSQLKEGVGQRLNLWPPVKC